MGVLSGKRKSYGRVGWTQETGGQEEDVGLGVLPSPKPFGDRGPRDFAGQVLTMLSRSSRLNRSTKLADQEKGRHRNRRQGRFDLPFFSSLSHQGGAEDQWGFYKEDRSKAAVIVQRIVF